jgi:hypothetical protein
VRGIALFEVVSCIFTLVSGYKSARYVVPSYGDSMRWNPFTHFYSSSSSSKLGKPYVRFVGPLWAGYGMETARIYLNGVSLSGADR